MGTAQPQEGSGQIQVVLLGPEEVLDFQVLLVNGRGGVGHGPRLEGFTQLREAAEPAFGNHGPSLFVEAQRLFRASLRQGYSRLR